MVDCGCDVIVGTEHEVDTVTVAVLLLADPQAFDTRTQYEKVWLPPTRIEFEVPPESGYAVLPLVPTYH